MDEQRSYRQRGSPDCPIDVYSSSAGPIHPLFTHWHPELELLVVTEGTLSYRLGRDIIPLSEGDIMVIAPGQIHGLQSYSGSIMIWTLVIAPEAITMPQHHVFQKEFVIPLQEDRLLLPDVLRPGSAAHDALYPLMKQLPDCWIYAPDYKMKRFALAVSVCAALRPYCSTVSSDLPALPQGHPAVKKCMRYIHRHYTEPLTLGSLSALVHLQPNYLCALFKEQTGQTVMQHLTQIRVDAAAFLLRNNDLPTSRITELTGFGSESVFFRRFKEHTGMTPKAYQKQFGQNNP